MLTNFRKVSTKDYYSDLIVKVLYSFTESLWLINLCLLLSYIFSLWSLNIIWAFQNCNLAWKINNKRTVLYSVIFIIGWIFRVKTVLETVPVWLMSVGGYVSSLVSLKEAYLSVMSALTLQRLNRHSLQLSLMYICIENNCLSFLRFDFGFYVVIT